MLDAVVREKIKQLKIVTHRLTKGGMSGDYSSAFKGSGLEFDQIREYQMGDDIRFIDWNSSAKINKIMVKQFIQERDRTVIIAVDTSTSLDYSSQDQTASDMLATVAGSLAYISSVNKDRVGALFFSDAVEEWLPPSREKSQLAKILHSIFKHRSGKRRTNVASVLKKLIDLKKRNAIVFLLSDFIDQSNYTRLLSRVGREYDCVALRFLDPVVTQFPDSGYLHMNDPETGQTMLFTTRSGTAMNIGSSLRTWLAEQKKNFGKAHIDMLDLTVGESFAPVLVRFFHQRIRRQI